ncbi:DUF2502 domain-containing protein [Pectobacterium brasiliense]|uniref:DUF2502 domain-containing protein n=1 Tax=Pectobacterium brasiliense TaxID=180957 RepID=UPI00196949D2|nr:DUF2502 domain-containing protein [Pectobacterium brasiliense]MBN3068721.1 DUF2502 domain-containing protein [Pectobacterium brasiliense]MBN3248311.1 DUF2502 domain-containing protein [Pectobacterium brasiliense]
MFKPLVISALFVGMFAVMPAPEAKGASIDLMPGVTLNIGERDRRGNYWDGYDWRSERRWQEHRGYHRGERNQHGYYWDGWRWRDARWWRESQRDRRDYDKRRFDPPRYVDDRGPRRGDWDRRGHERGKGYYRNGRGSFRD